MTNIDKFIEDLWRIFPGLAEKYNLDTNDALEALIGYTATAVIVAIAEKKDFERVKAAALMQFESTLSLAAKRFL